MQNNVEIGGAHQSNTKGWFRRIAKAADPYSSFQARTHAAATHFVICVATASHHTVLGKLLGLYRKHGTSLGRQRELWRRFGFGFERQFRSGCILLLRHPLISQPQLCGTWTGWKSWLCILYICLGYSMIGE